MVFSWGVQNGDREMRTIVATLTCLLWTNLLLAKADLGIKTGYYDSMAELGLDVGVSLTRRIMVSFDSSVAARDTKNLEGFEAYRYLDASLAVTRHNLALKYFLTKSTYVKLKTGYRTHELFNTAFAATNAELLLTNKASSYVVGAAVGNVWRFDNGVFLACEWFGYEQPVEQGFKETVLLASAGDKFQFQSRFSRKQSELEMLSKSSAISLFNVHLGVSF